MHFDLVTFFVSQQVNFFIQRRHAVEREINHFYTYELLLNSSLRHYMFHLLHRYYRRPSVTLQVTECTGVHSEAHYCDDDDDDSRQ